MYKCQMPDCNYMCENRSQIHFHHIIPRSMGGGERGNLIELCPNCHARIYIEGMTTGPHSIKNNNSIIIEGKFLSTGGYVLGYRDIGSDDIKYSLLK